MFESKSKFSAGLYFLQRDPRWETEKPYEFNYPPGNDAPQTNTSLELRSVQIENIRGRENNFTYERNGFAIISLDTPLQRADFEDDQKIKAEYLRFVGESLQKAIGAARVQVYDYTVRKRDGQFPYSTGGHYTHKQPTSLAHVDTTPADMKRIRDGLAEADPDILRFKRFQSINVWKPLHGPLRDWPLTVCDSSSVAQEDLRARDTITRLTHSETYQIHHSPSQRWYYISDQMPTEAWIFNQGESVINGKIGAPHTSFQWPFSAETDHPRESIEVRCMAYFND